ncbi:LysE family translocator [Pseudohoeflea coraliihabitans]|uniref:LysE family translocator n=1 Tax=Pseudohoeflea coraliihabitans TaxID=2860393 RepID=A0ABS6WMW6_9HYPH|nr:LysE family translocator [Pseudohoeflea sp. DP4N28-3]MBW3096747.1 LysE family translocator [Pseudohoeflea sp. DP4N28-3]
MDFVPALPTLLAFSVAALILAITPGPDMTLLISRSLSNGRVAAFACAAGASTGIAIHTLLVALGISALVVASPAAFLGLKIFGAGYLAWLAWQAVRHGSTLSLKTAGKADRSLFSNWAQGLGVNLLNPKIILFFMTFLPQFVAASDPHLTGKLIFLGFLFVVLSAPILVGIAVGAHGLAGWLRRKPGVMRIIDWLFAGVFSLFALRILMVQTR